MARVRAEVQDVGLALEGLVRWVVERRKVPHANPGELFVEHVTRNRNGEAVAVRLRLCIKNRWHLPETWTCSAVMYGIRVDGIDHHVEVTDVKGQPCRGWRRHGWDPVRRSVDGLYECLPEFGPLESLADYVAGCCAELGFRLEKGGTEE